MTCCPTPMGEGRGEGCFLEEQKTGGQAIYVILNLFQNLFIRCIDAKRHRGKAVIKNKFCPSFTKTAINVNSVPSCLLAIRQH